jgi:S1-C subfamily serine protease
MVSSLNVFRVTKRFLRMLLTASLTTLPQLLGAQSSQSPTVQLGPGDIYKASSPAVVLIETYGDDGKVSGSGSGFIVSADGRILTNFHVIAHSKRATVRLPNEDAYDTVEVLDVDKRKDIALLKIKAVNQPFVKLGHSNTAQVGDKVYTLGNPLGAFFQNTLSDGILSGVRQMDGYKLFQLSAPSVQCFDLPGYCFRKLGRALIQPLSRRARLASAAGLFYQALRYYTLTGAGVPFCLEGAA